MKIERGITILHSLKSLWNRQWTYYKRSKPMSKRPIVRPKLHWEDDVLEDIKSMNVRNWKNVVQNRDRWKKVVEQAITLNRL
jgi:hypothetical protein